METKICTECNIEKPLSEYYRIPGSGNPMRYCKECKRKIQKQYDRRENSRSKSRNPHEQGLVEMLRSKGIYAVTGKGSEFPYVDVVAWGCVRIEVKSSNLVYGKSYQFGFSADQKGYGMRADLVCLIARNYFSPVIIPASHPVFYKTSGKLKSNINWIPNARKYKSRRGLISLTTGMMLEHQECWDLIEQVRQSRIRELLDSGTINYERAKRVEA